MSRITFLSTAAYPGFMVELPKLDIYINQNVIVLIISLLALGIAEFFALPTLYFIGLILSIWMGISVAASMTWYSLRYIRQRRNR